MNEEKVGLTNDSIRLPSPSANDHLITNLKLHGTNFININTYPRAGSRSNGCKHGHQQLDH